VSVEVKRPQGYALPSLEVLEAALPELIKAASDEAGFEPVTVTYRK
jgi:hypothetical protein